jgi:uncharacterized protein
MSLREYQEHLFEQIETGKIKTLSKKSKIPFKCTLCGNCCRNLEVVLTSFDILEASRFLKMSSLQFCKQYVAFHTGSNSHLPIAMLEQIQHGACAFLKDRKCSIHPSRPGVCRLYPLGKVTRCDLKKGTSEDIYFMQKHQKCPGINSGHSTTFEKFSKAGHLKEWAKGSKLFHDRMLRLIENFHLECLTDAYRLPLTLLIYAPDSFVQLKQPRGTLEDSYQLVPIGFELAEKFLDAKGFRRN